MFRHQPAKKVVDCLASSFPESCTRARMLPPKPALLSPAPIVACQQPVWHASPRPVLRRCFPGAPQWNSKFAMLTPGPDISGKQHLQNSVVHVGIASHKFDVTLRGPRLQPLEVAIRSLARIERRFVPPGLWLVPVTLRHRLRCRDGNCFGPIKPVCCSSVVGCTSYMELLAAG